MPLIESSVVVLGAGRLAAAVRVRLRSSLSFRPSLLRDTFDGDAALFLACSDFENATVRTSLARRATDDGVQILFAALTDRTLRVGPFISARRLRMPVTSYLTRSWDFSPMKKRGSSFVAPNTAFVASRELVSPHVDTGVAQVAQIGASLVVGELAKILCMTGELTLDRCVCEIDSPTHKGEWSDLEVQFPTGCLRTCPTPTLPTLFSDTRSDFHDEAFERGGIEWRLKTVKPARGWHSASLD